MSNRQRESFLNIDEPAPLWFSVIIVICYGVYRYLPKEMQEYTFFAGALLSDGGRVFIPDRPLGNFPTLLTHTLLHANWTHVLMNAGLMLAFGVITMRGVKNRHIPVMGRFRRSSIVYLVILCVGAMSGGVLQWIVWAISGQSGAAIGASTAGAALFATTAWALGGQKRLIAFGIFIVAFDAINIMISGLGPQLSNPAWAGHLGGYLAGAALAPFFIKAGSATLGMGNWR